MPYGYVVIKGQGRTMMVDVGYNHQAYGKVLAKLRGGELAAAHGASEWVWRQTRCRRCS